MSCAYMYLEMTIDNIFQNGPMVPGVPPQEASDRLIIFQSHFDTLYRKYETYTGGERLFGLPVTEYPELLQIMKELKLLKKLYELYNGVIDTVHGYYDIPWQDVNIERINLELQDFQNRSDSDGNCNFKCDCLHSSGLVVSVLDCQP